MLNEKEMVSIAVKALDDKQGKDIKVLRTADQTTLADYFIICNGTSNTQVRALADAVEEAMSKAGEEPHHIEGHRGNQWTLMDYSAVVIHVFTEEGREFYGLERLWSDAEAVDIAEFLTEKAE
ncbi:MAG: ribosome silencing factor [Clostridiales bacterium]|nr:ribosome silencing factor [Clostridiales bacterium]